MDSFFGELMPSSFPDNIWLEVYLLFMVNIIENYGFDREGPNKIYIDPKTNCRLYDNYCNHPVAV